MIRLGGLLLAALCSVVAGSVPDLPAGDIAGYLSFDQALQYAKDLHQAAPGLVSELEEIGKSVEGRPLVVFCVGHCTKGAGKTLFTALHHSREPVGLMVSLDFARVVVAAALEGDPRALTMLARRALWVMPVVNPDGYEWNKKHFPNGLGMERKNRRPGCSRKGDTMGVDLNRNYDYKFTYDAKGSSNSPCAEDYRGTGPFSEPESAAVRDFFKAHTSEARGKSSTRTLGNVNVALNWHSYGQVVNVPYSHQDSGEPPADDYKVFKQMGERFHDSSNFKVGQAWAGNGLYTVNGDAADWMYDTHGAFAFSPEVGPFFDYNPFEAGMWPPKSLIAPVVNESMAIAGTAVWGAAPLPLLKVETAVMSPYRGDTAPGHKCYTLRVQFAVTNAGVVPTDSRVMLSLTLEDEAGELEAGMAGGLSRRGLPHSPSSPSCPVPAYGGADRAVDDDFTFHEEIDSRQLGSSTPGLRRKLTQRQLHEEGGKGAAGFMSFPLPRQLHGADGYEHPPARVVRSGGRLRLVSAVQGSVPPAGRATLSMPLCLCDGEDGRITLGECAVADAVAKVAESVPGGMSHTHPARLTVVVSDAHMCAAHSIAVGATRPPQGIMPLIQTGTNFEPSPFRHMSSCPACAAHRYAATADFGVVAEGLEAREVSQADAPAPIKCGEGWSQFMAAPGAAAPAPVVLLDGQSLEAAELAVGGCARTAADIPALPLSAPEPTPLAEVVSTGAASSAPLPSPSSSSQSAPSGPTASTSPAPAVAASSPPAAVQDGDRLRMVDTENKRAKEARDLDTTGWVVAAVAMGVAVMVALALLLPGADSSALPPVLAASRANARRQM